MKVDMSPEQPLRHMLNAVIGRGWYIRDQHSIVYVVVVMTSLPVDPVKL